MADRRVTRSRSTISTITPVAVAIQHKKKGTKVTRNVEPPKSLSSPKSKHAVAVAVAAPSAAVSRKRTVVTENAAPKVIPTPPAVTESIEGQERPTTGSKKNQVQKKGKRKDDFDVSKTKRVLEDADDAEPLPHSSTSLRPDFEVGDVEDIALAPKWVPVDWRKALRYIRMMRAERTAPVDTMGCERTMEENVEPKVRRYQALVSLMLSSQTKDQVTFAAMGRLKAHGLTVQSILDMDEATLGQMITPVGFWKKKADYIKRATEILRSKYDDDIPETIEGLCALPGVGPKMGYIALSVGWGKNAGIGVDTHVHRIANRLKWTGSKGTKTPEQTRLVLESWLPVDLWQEVNILLVGFGQEQCLPVNPKCSTCLVNEVCPTGIKELNLGFLLSKKSKRTVD